jgi:septum formation protein
MSHATLILASASPRRREILGRLGVPFEVEMARGVDEEAVRGDGRAVAMCLSRMKAESVREAFSRKEAGSPPVVLGGDTVVALGEDPGDVLGKPADSSHAREMLRRLSGRAHTVWTGVTIISERGDALVEVEATRVVFRSLSGREIESYIATGDFEGKAGAYGIQGAASSLIEGFHGC